MSLLTPALIAKENLRVHQERLMASTTPQERRYFLTLIALDEDVVKALEAKEKSE